MTGGAVAETPNNEKIEKNTAISGKTAAEDYPEGLLESGSYIIKEGGIR